MHGDDVDGHKRELREAVWSSLQEAGAARFPGARGRIPNFTGAEEAAERLAATDLWAAASTVKSNPDSPQWPVRQRALASGRIVVVAVPRLAEEHPFLRLDPHRLEVSPRDASSIKGAARHGTPTSVEDIGPVGIVVVGCVAVDRSGARLGKGGGFADLEFALASAAGFIGPDTPVVTTVHPLQVLEEGRIPMTDHDVPIDAIVTSEEVIRCGRERARPDGVLWGHLSEVKINEIPLLRRLAAQRAE